MLDGFLPLLCGVTGFAPAVITPAGIDAKDFRRACWDIAIDLGGQVTAFGADRLAPNHYRANLTLSNTALREFCNHRYSVVALVPQGRTPKWTGDCVYVWHADVAAAFARLFDFKMLDPTLLCSVVTSGALALLDQVERRQVKHWKPEILGDVIFSNWD